MDVGRGERREERAQEILLAVHTMGYLKGLVMGEMAAARLHRFCG